MIGIEIAYCNTAIDALVQANFNLLESRIDDAVKHVHVWMKGDTLGLDAIPESTIAETLKRFDQYAILVTEERGQEANPLALADVGNRRGQRVVTRPPHYTASVVCAVSPYSDACSLAIR